jgi:sugar lactone lactonase YvrE
MKTTVLADNVKFPEGPRWHDGKLWFSDYSTNQVMNADLKGNVQMVVQVPDFSTAVCWTPDGRLLVVASSTRRLLRLENDGLVEVADMSHLVPYPCGELIVDGQGRAYVGNVNYDIFSQGVGFQDEPENGLILLVTPDGSARIVADGLAFPNGMVITPDGKTLIVAESHASRVTAFTIEADGSLSHRRIWAQFDGGEIPIVPDGICLDAEGAVWMASPPTREVLRVHDGGQILNRIPVDTFPLACMLGGTDRRTLFILTTETLNPMDSSIRGRIETVQVEFPGAGLP